MKRLHLLDIQLSFPFEFKHTTIDGLNPSLGPSVPIKENKKQTKAKERENQVLNLFLVERFVKSTKKNVLHHTFPTNEQCY